MSRVHGLLVTVLCAALPVLLQAHAIVVRSQPTADAVVTAGSPIDLEFNSRIDASRSRLQVLDAQGAATVLTIEADGHHRLRAQLPALATGNYHLEWYVLSADGHITRGRLRFRVAVSR